MDIQGLIMCLYATFHVIVCPHFYQASVDKIDNMQTSLVNLL